MWNFNPEIQEKVQRRSPENVSRFSEIVSQFPENIPQFPENISWFPENVLSKKLLLYKKLNRLT